MSSWCCHEGHRLQLPVQWFPCAYVHTLHSWWTPTRSTLQQFLLPSAGSPFPCLPCGASLAHSWAGKQGTVLLMLQPLGTGARSQRKVNPCPRAPQGVMTGAYFSSTLSMLPLFGYTTLASLKNSSAASRAISRSCQSNGIVQSLPAHL